MAILIDKLYKRFVPQGKQGFWCSLVKCEDCGNARSILSTHAKKKQEHLCMSCCQKGIKNHRRQKFLISPAIKKQYVRKGRRFGCENHSWNPNLTEQDRIDRRKKKEYTEWAKQVKYRDNYTCQICNDDSGGNLISHHLNGYLWCIDERFAINNGICLCEECHKEYHHIFGNKNNTKSEFFNWKSYNFII